MSAVGYCPKFFELFFVGVILILAGVCLLVNKKARTAATSLGLTILLTVFRDLPADAPGRSHRRGCAELFPSTHCFSAEPFCCWRTRLTKNQRWRGVSAEYPLGPATCGACHGAGFATNP
jgi:hypothetical protein